MSPTTAVVVGATGGLGAACVEALATGTGCSHLLALSRKPPADAAPGRVTVVHAPIDLEQEVSIAQAAAQAADLPPIRLVLVATGLLHAADGLSPEKSMRALDAAALQRLFAVNAVGPALVAKHFMPRMPRQGRVVFAAVSARVGSISDNRLGGWYGYRASKAALNQLIRTLSIEWSRTSKDSICVGLHPGTVDTALSAPFQGNVAPGGLFTPAQSASALLQVLDQLTPEQTGRVFAWDGREVPA
jgi:NAD(P)-dependent dehydrogenase (short-subunit alcohol dehydrogenase family)